MEKESKEGKKETGMININGALGALFAMVHGPQQSTHFRNAPDRLEKAIYHRL